MHGISGDVEVELSTEENNPLDEYKVNRLELESLDWSTLPIKPLERQHIVAVESSEKPDAEPPPPPTTNKEIIIIEKEKYSVPVHEAIALGNYFSN